MLFYGTQCILIHLLKEPQSPYMMDYILILYIKIKFSQCVEKVAQVSHSKVEDPAIWYLTGLDFKNHKLLQTTST